jgi:hypothetical protein
MTGIRSPRWTDGDEAGTEKDNVWTNKKVPANEGEQSGHEQHPPAVHDRRGSCIAARESDSPTDSLLFTDASARIIEQRFPLLRVASVLTSCGRRRLSLLVLGDDRLLSSCRAPYDGSCLRRISSLLLKQKQ